MRLRAAICLLALGCSTDPTRKSGEIEKARYLRPSGESRVVECSFEIRRTGSGWSIASVTERGQSTLRVTAHYDAQDELVEAEAVLTIGAEKKTACVTVASAKARVEAVNRPAQEFDAPKGVIVTSEPDWTDTFLLCRLRNRNVAKQEFPGLWIHPERPSQRLSFTVERLGVETLDLGERKLNLDRLALTLRGRSRYVAWADDTGRMIKLVSIPYKRGGTDLVLEGFEASAASLKPD